MLSANTLFHFTGSMDNLINILENEFRPRFCLEDFSLSFAKMPRPVRLELAIPVVCFCDIPLSQTLRHLAAYGDYGIGMTKAWGQRNGITPVLYLHNESFLASTLGRLIEQIRDGLPKSDFQNSLSTSIFDLACFVKPYEGTFSHNGIERKVYRFYDEREWRFVPALTEHAYRKGMSKSDFQTDEIRLAANDTLSRISRLSFEPNDIKYLIVRSETEIVEFVRELRRIKGKYGEDAKDLVASRVISAEQIRSDF